MDRGRIYVSGGRGGDGMMSFRREKYVPLGGPDGGNGGRGGDVILVASKKINTLLDFKYQPRYKAEDGKKGEPSNRTGACGSDLIIEVPVGTVVYKDGKFLADLISDGEKVVVAHGGRGGRGNKSFKSQYNTAPRIYEKGQPPERCVIDLELKLISDVGIVGHPNAGKSSLLARLTSAHPRIAPYPFTTLSPNIGVANVRGKTITLADIPGLIEGAREGKGLGLDFLRHIERTRVLIHIVDGSTTSSSDGKTPFDNYRIVYNEIKSYSEEIVKRPTIVVFNKIDIPQARKNLPLFRRQLKGAEVVPISAVTGEGLETLKIKLLSLMKKADTQGGHQIEEYKSHSSSALHDKKDDISLMHFVYEKPFAIHRADDGVWIIKGKKIEDIVAMTDFDNEETFERFQRIIKKIGIDDALKLQGAKTGDIVRIAGKEFEYS